jgi:hypothetical protein
LKENFVPQMPTHFVAHLLSEEWGAPQYALAGTDAERAMVMASFQIMVTVQSNV